MAFTRARVAVFVDGCFWHGCPEHATWPAHNSDWWRSKLENNTWRDRETDDLLEQAGWLVIRVWEHEAVDVSADRVTRAMRTRRG